MPPSAESFHRAPAVATTPSTPVASSSSKVAKPRERGPKPSSREPAARRSTAVHSTPSTAPKPRPKSALKASPAAPAASATPKSAPAQASPTPAKTLSQLVRKHSTESEEATFKLLPNNPLADTFRPPSSFLGGLRPPSLVLFLLPSAQLLMSRQVSPQTIGPRT